VKSPARWLDAGAGAPPGARELLGVAAPAPAFTDELRYRLGAGVAKTAALPVAAAWPALLLKGVAVAAIGGASGLAVHSWSGQHRTPAPSVVAPVAPTVVVAPPQPEPRAVPVDALPALQLPTAPPDRAPRLRLDPRLEEAELLEKARALVGGNPSAALKLVAEHSRDFPRGRLGAEADLIAAQSLLAMGKVAAAKARAEASLQRYPGGLYARQLREITER
jgi:hypothetical protein